MRRRTNAAALGAAAVMLLGAPLASAAPADGGPAAPLPGAAGEAPSSTPASAAPLPGTASGARELSAEASSGSKADSAELLRAYHAALSARRLDAFGALSLETLRELLEAAESQLALGRRDDASFVLAALVESPRFAPLRDLPEGRAARFLLGDALGRARAYTEALRYLQPLLSSPEVDAAARRAAMTLVELGLSSGEGERFLAALSALPAGVAPPWAGDVAFLRGMLHERAGRPDEALAEYAAVPPSSRYWAQATYRAGLLEVERRGFQQGERHFCRIADPEQTPRVAPVFGGNAFFEVRDLARLALGRVAHEQYRFDDARYYYHLVPGDSERLPEALYEAATSRYEAKDYEGAHALLDELRALERPHVYADEAWILEAYVDLGRCEFPKADARLQEFLRRYEPVLAAARQLQSDPRALRGLLQGGASQSGGMGVAPQVGELLAASIRMDPTYGALTRRLRDLEHQASGLEAARRELDEVLALVLRPDGVRPHLAAPLADAPADRLRRLEEQTAAVRRLLRDASGLGTAAKAELGAVEQELVRIEAEAEELGTARVPGESRAAPAAPPADTADLPALMARDAALARELERAAEEARVSLLREQDALAVQALARLDQRLTRLVRRARAGRIETVLGRKRALELEIEALSQGYLPRGAVDSLDAARYLSDDEEYWPIDGEDWDDEYVGGEGLR